MSLCNWFPDCEVRATSSLKTLDQLRKRFDVLLEPIEGADAYTWFLTNPDAECPVAIVYVSEGANKNQRSAIVAHEAVHCARYYLRGLGEKKPSSEFEAYLVQAFVSEILEQLDEERGEISEEAV